MPDGSSKTHLLSPKLATVLREGYPLANLRKDAAAGLTVAIVALPLSMAIAVASGVQPGQGLTTAIVGGFIVSALSGSRYQIGGPAGAFIVLVAAAVAAYGLSGLALIVILSGLMLGLLGVLRLGALIRHIPHAVTVGFTIGVAITIFASQLKDLGGLTVRVPEPGPLIPKLFVLSQALSSARPWPAAVGFGSAGIIFAVRRWRPSWPGMLIAVVAASGVCAALSLPVQTIATRFGALPHGLPAPRAPEFSLKLLIDVLPMSLSFTLLGAVESLLSAKVADGMTARKHRPNMELLAQGAANVAAAFFGGLPVTGTVARTATNIRAGAVSPFAGMLHAAFLLTFALVAAPLAGYIPLAALAGVLLVVCWNMAEKAEFVRLLRAWPTAVVLLLTLGLTLLKDLTFGIVAGCLAAALFAFLRRPVAQEGLDALPPP